MPAFSLIKKADNCYDVEGDITYTGINKKTMKPIDFLSSAENTCIDLAKVNSADSAGLALMIEWLKQSKLNNKKLTFKNIPQQLLTIAALSGLDLNDYLD